MAAVSSRQPAYTQPPSSTVATGRKLAAVLSVQPAMKGHEPSLNVAVGLKAA